MRADEARRISEQAFSEEEFEKVMDTIYEKIKSAAGRGERDTYLDYGFFKDGHWQKPDSLGEKVKHRLLEEGYRIERKSKFIGCWQDPADYVCW